MEKILTVLLISLAVQTLFFTLAYLKKTDRYTDLSYGGTFILVSLFLLITGNGVHLRQAVILIMVMAWGTRLASYLFIRILKIKRDTRFDEIRTNFWQFARFWFLQGVSVWLIMLSTTLAFSINASKVSMVNILGFCIWVVGFLLEAIADKQKYHFLNTHINTWVNIGLWKYSRHPNYFGEMLCWWGLFIAVLNPTFDIQILGIVSPLYITGLLIFVTGLPPLEKRMDKKFAGNRAYEQYKKETSILVPLPKINSTEKY